MCHPIGSTIIINFCKKKTLNVCLYKINTFENVEWLKGRRQLLFSLSYNYEKYYTVLSFK